MVPWFVAYKISQLIKSSISNRLFGLCIALVAALIACYYVWILAFFAIVAIPFCPTMGGQEMETQICSIVDERWFLLSYTWVVACLGSAIFADGGKQSNNA
jgi:hypothetical protein